MKKFKYKIILFFCILLFSYSIFNILNWYKDSNSIAKESENLLNTANVINSEIASTEENTTNTLNSSNSINFDGLEEINKDVVGWIQVDGTNINYPIVQTKDNSYYLNHSFSKEENKSGWIFLDYRNDINNFDKNTIIYGHSRYDSSMFGSLRNCLKKSWFNSSKNREVHLTIKSGNTTWKIFSVYHLPITSDYLATSFKNDEEFNSFIKLIKNRTVFDFGIKITSKDKILTLSTCFRTNERMVVHAKLIS